MKLNLQNTVTFSKFLFLITFFAPISFAANDIETWKVKFAKTPTIKISNNVIHTNDPKNIFGFNINHREIQKQLWDQNEHQLKPDIAEALEPFQGAIYRFPGGLVSNSFQWKESTGDLRSRVWQSSYFDKTLKPALFGIEEYMSFVSSQGGTPWYVLNLVGVDPSYPMKVADIKDVVKSNQELVQYLLELLPDNSTALHLQLGNELDRARYQWTDEVYANRAKAVIDGIEQLTESERIKFVSFMRDFNWKYKGEKSKLPVSKSKDFMAGVFNTIGDSVDDYSLHHYYDGNRVDGRSRSIPYWLRLLTRSFDDYRSIENREPSVWITEHGRQPMSRQPGKDKSRQSTSNMSAAISTADYLIAISQFAEVKGAVWHALNAGPWQLFDYSVKYKDLRPRPIYWGLRVLRMIDLNNSLETQTASPNLSKYDGGYDIRAASFRNDDNSKVGLRLVNRAAQEQEVRIQYESYSQQKVLMKHYSASLAEGQDPESENVSVKIVLEPTETEGQFNDNGAIYITLPASSVSSVEINRVIKN